MVGKILQALYNFRSKIYKTSSNNYSNSKAVMKEAELFQNTNKITRKDSLEALEEYSSRIQWKVQNAKILDVGSGDGGVTVQVLKPFLPKNFEKLVGYDISKEMVTHANLHHKNERIEFKVLDIEADVTDMMGQFDHVFSFYTLHWVQDQTKAHSNIYSMLVPGGDCLLLFICHQPVYNTYRTMASSSTWSQYMLDIENSISPYHGHQKPEEEYTNLMIKCGFKNVEVQCKNKNFVFKDLDVLKNLLRSVNPVIHRVPPALKERFMHDYMKELMQTDGISKMINKNDEIEEIKMVYTLLLAYASK